jgi:hypothetical protein
MPDPKIMCSSESALPSQYSSELRKDDKVIKKPKEPRVEEDQE